MDFSVAKRVWDKSYCQTSEACKTIMQVSVYGQALELFHYIIMNIQQKALSQSLSELVFIILYFTSTLSRLLGLDGAVLK